MKEINLKFDLSHACNAEHYQLHDDIRPEVDAKLNFKLGDNKPSTAETGNGGVFESLAKI